MEVSREHPIYTISVVAQLLNLHEQTIRQYERLGLICPCRTLKKTRLYSQEDVERLECIVYLVKTCGVNLSGVQIVITLSTQHPEINEMLKSKRIFPQALGGAVPYDSPEETHHDQAP
jgi:MerR family transcriptional regulator/heat shock protein HspR